MNLLFPVESALATARLERLITTDVITEGLRKRLWARFPPWLATIESITRPGPLWEPVYGLLPQVWHRDPSRFGAWLNGMLTCPSWCASLWSGLAVAVLGCCGPVGRLLVRALAGSMFTGLLYQTILADKD